MQCKILQAGPSKKRTLKLRRGIAEKVFTAKQCTSRILHAMVSFSVQIERNWHQNYVLAGCLSTIHSLTHAKKKDAVLEQNATQQLPTYLLQFTVARALHLALQVQLPAGGPGHHLGAGLGRLLRRREHGARAADGAGGARAEPGVDAGGVERVPASGQRAHRVPVLQGAQAHRALRRRLAAVRVSPEPEHWHGR
jgi:hypothetical protein